MYQVCFYTSFQLHLHYWERIELERDENLSYLVNADVPSSEIRLPGHQYAIYYYPAINKKSRLITAGHGSVINDAP